MSEREPWRDRLRHALRQDRRKQSAVARQAGIDPSTLSRMLNGRLSPRFETMIRLADTLGVPLSWIAGEEVTGFLLNRADLKALREVSDFLDKLSREPPSRT